MKNKIFYIGIVTCMVVTLGCIFKISHWPGANILITFGIFILCLVFLPLAFYNNYKGNIGKKSATLYVVVFIIILLSFVGSLFKIMHWPGSKWAVPVNLALFFLVLPPAYFFVNRNKKEINYKEYLAIAFFFAYFAAISVLLGLNVSKNSVDNTLDSAIRLDKQSELISRCNQFLYKQKSDSTTYNFNDKEIEKASELLIADIEKAKYSLAANEGGYDAANSKKGLVYINIEKKDARIERRLIEEDAPVIKHLLDNYRELLLSKVTETELRNQITKLLSTSERNGRSWESEYFEGYNVVMALQQLNVLKYEVLLANNLALCGK